MAMLSISLSLRWRDSCIFCQLSTARVSGQRSRLALSGVPRLAEGKGSGLLVVM